MVRLVHANNFKSEEQPSSLINDQYNREYRIVHIFNITLT